MSTRLIDVRLDMGEHERYSVATCRVRERISTRSTALVEIASSEDIEFDRALTQSATLTLLLEGVETRRWTLKVDRVRFKGIVGGLLRYEVVLHDPLWLLGLLVNTRKFRNQTTADIVTRVLRESGLASSWQTTRAMPVRKYTAQYRETNLTFVERLLERDGIYYTFDADGTAVFGDDSNRSPNTPGQHHFELRDAAGGLQHDEQGIHQLRRGRRLASGTATVNDYNWKRPRVGLMQSKTAGEEGALEVYDYPAGFREPDQGATLAQMRLEALRVGARYVEGKSSVLAFAPAHAFVFGSRAGNGFAGDYVLVEIEHRMDNPIFAASDDDSSVYENVFRAIPRSTAFRPPLRTPRAAVSGCHTAVVRGPAGSEIHTDKHGRFRAQFHWDRDGTGTDEDSRWIRMLQESATSMTLARVGWEVSVAYIDGDPDRPVGIARNINGLMIPAYAQPASKNVMSVKTPSSPATGGYNELKLDDSAGDMRFDLRAEKDLIGIVQNDKTERIGHSELHLVGKDLKHEVQRDQTLQIGADETVVVNGDYLTQINGNRNKTVGGSEKVDVGASENVTVAANQSERVGSVRLTVAGSIGPPNIARMAKSAIPSPRGAATSVAMGAVSGGAAGAVASLKAMVPSASMQGLVGSVCHGSISRSASKSISRTVGGAFVSLALMDITTSVMLGYAETVGGVKLTLARKDVTEQVQGMLVSTTGGAVLRTAAQDMQYSARSSRVTVGGVAMLSSLDRVSIRGASIRVKALGGLKLKSADLSIELSPTSLTMKGDLKMTASEKISFTGGPEDLTKA